MGDKRPAGWECPWCGPNAAPVDFSIPLELRICECCAGRCGPCEACARFAQEQATKEEESRRARQQVVDELRPLLVKAVVDIGGPRWQGCEFGKTIIGNSILEALQAHGCDPAEELRRAGIPSRGPFSAPK